MARFVIADDGICFDGNSPLEGPLGGVESSVVNLCNALAARGHEVLVRNRCLEAVVVDGVDWAPIDFGLPITADMYIANRGDKLIPLMPQAGRKVFWIHNPAHYLLKWRYFWKLWKHKPTIIFIGEYHESTYPAWAPGGERVIIPYGISDDFMAASRATFAPAPRAIFTSNPLRSLHWLLDLWQYKIHPYVPESELHIFSGPTTYGSIGEDKEEQMCKILIYAKTLKNKGVIVRDPVSKSELVKEFQRTRVMLYRGDINETFCLALGEAQASGIPAVIQQFGSVGERVQNGVTGIIANSDEEFSEAAIKILKDDAYWFKIHQNALNLQRNLGWPQVAEAFERLLP